MTRRPRQQGGLRRKRPRESRAAILALYRQSSLEWMYSTLDLENLWRDYQKLGRKARRK